MTRQTLSAAKALLNLSCSAAARPLLLQEPRLAPTWISFAEHTDVKVRTRAAVVATQMLGDLETHSQFIALPHVVDALTKGPLARDSGPKFDALRTTLQRDAVPTEDDGKGMSPPPSMDDCAPLFRGHFADLYSSQPRVVVKALSTLLKLVSKDKTKRGEVAHGGGAQHVVYALKRYQAGPRVMLMAVMRVTNNVVLDDTAEKALFAAGAFPSVVNVLCNVSQPGLCSDCVAFHECVCVCSRVSVLFAGHVHAPARSVE